MAIPVVLRQLLSDVPEKYLAEVFRILKINETQVFKKFCLRQGGRDVYKGFILSLFNADRAVVEALYRRIEGVLFVMGCAPGLGIAFNVVDACFCAVLGNWFGLFVAILSCFPIPGFKAAGKGLERLLSECLKKIPLNRLIDTFTKAIGKRLELLSNVVSKNPYVSIRDTVKKCLSEINNPFADETVRQLNKIINTFGPRLEEHSISGCAKMSDRPFVFNALNSKIGRQL